MFFSKSEYLSARAMVTVPSVSCQLWCPKVSKGERREAGIQWIQPPKAFSDPEFRQTTSGAHGSANRADCLPRGKPFGAPVGAAPLSRVGIDAPTPARLVGLPPRGGSTFFRSARKYQRKHAARRLQRRPTSLCTATKPCAALGLGYALHGFQPFLALVGLRPPLAVGFGLREPNGWMPRINSGHPIPALRPEQSDHVPWADCPQGLSSTLVRFAHPSGKKPLIAHFDSGARNVARNGLR